MGTPYEKHQQRKRECAHIDTDEQNGAVYCYDCESIIQVECDACNGEGMVYEDDYEFDWINYGHNWISCPECHGSGWFDC